MSSSSQSDNSSSSSYSEQNSSKIELKDNRDSFYEYQKEREKLKQFTKKAKMLKFKYTEKKKETLYSRKKFFEEKAKNKGKRNQKRALKMMKYLIIIRMAIPRNAIYATKLLRKQFFLP